ncbi:hypothetical protein EAI_04349 [Harpegnathos saltator]|uniref:Uncharacterized protein n=1 Tax=Harpegnathos saltator TaxID=610380 RepID=E2B3Y0_HARSA|nr:hypothetical protein EAI_04349 [Harpegnathos saltator]
MSQLFKIIRDCIIAASVANPIIKRGKYLCELASDNDEKTYEMFYKFAAMYNSGLLAMLFACRRFKNNPHLYGIAAEDVEARRLLGENEGDIGDRVQDMLLSAFRNKIARTDKDIACNINENGIDISHDDAVLVTGNIIEYDDNEVDETTQDVSETGETQDFLILQTTLVESKERVTG